MDMNPNLKCVKDCLRGKDNNFKCLTRIEFNEMGVKCGMFLIHYT